MPFEIPSDLNPDLVALAWMIGSWQGSGKASYPGSDDIDFGQQIDFSHNGGSYLHYLSQTYEVGEDGTPTKPLQMETGFWRPQSDGSLEVVMSHPEGVVEVWYGHITGAKIEIATDAVARTASAPDYTAGHRLYGQVEGDLLWTFDKAADGQSLQNYQWGRLQRIAA
ncbi:FABP family protein [Microlunatus elymi]|uniref:Ferric nitrobindin-like protein n=1 Tax=Microlunatus elymi TaxID=2596828 RepID=A0A516Q475_9ACTN|nr:FABP family protein [Microlunatus elymi]QDP98218.1 FABP family protein [Microlunatus elymi]